MAKITIKRIGGAATLLVFLLGIILMGTAHTASQVQASGRFDDIAAEDLNRVYIDYIISEGIMAGFPDGDFHPGEPLTRAQAAVIMCNAFQRKINFDADSGFRDVPLSHWSATYIKAAAEYGYLNRLPDNIYNPEEALTRAEGVCMVLGLSRQSYTGVKLPPLGDMDENHWAAPAIALALDAGLLQTEKGGLVRPDSPMTRSELCRALAVLLTSDPKLYESKLTGTLKVEGGEVWMGRVDSPAHHIVKGSLPVKAGDIIETFDDGKAIIEYPDGSRLFLKSGTCLTIKEARGRHYIKKDGTAGIAVDKLELECPYGELLGSLSTLTYAQKPGGEPDQTGNGTTDAPWYQTASQTRDKIDIQLPGGLFSIRGTVFMVMGQSVAVLEGNGLITTPGGSAGLEALQQCQLDSLEKAVVAGIMSRQISQQVLQNLQFILNSTRLQEQNRAAEVPDTSPMEQLGLVNRSLAACLRTVLAPATAEQQG